MNPACRGCDGSLSPEHLRGSEARCVLLTLADYHSIKTRSTKVNRPQFEINRLGWDESYDTTRLGGQRGQQNQHYYYYYYGTGDAAAPPGQPAYSYSSYRSGADYK